MELNGYNEVKKIWSSITTQEDVKDINFDVEAFKKLLDIFQVGDYYYFIANVRKFMFEMVSPEIEQVLGYTHEEMNMPLFASLMHPDDLPHYLNFEAAITDFFSRISGEKLFKYKVQHDFRIRKADGNYIRVLNQFVIIQHDADDVRTFVVNTDITRFKKETQPILSFIGLEGEPSYYNVDVKNLFVQTSDVFTKREKEVLKALAEGMSSAGISEALNISKLTVDSHRKNMLRKTGAKSASEMIGLAFANGWV